MEISYLGHSCFKIKGKKSTVVCDPFSEEIGKMPRDLEANLLTISHDHSDHNQRSSIRGEVFVIDGPGEYEVGGVSVVGVPTDHDDKGGSERGKNTVFVIELEGMRVCHLGDLGHKLTQSQLDEIGSVDVLLVPVGGKYTIDAKAAHEVVSQIDPWIAIPMHYKMANGAGLTDISGVEEFLKEMGKEGLAAIPKLIVSADKMPEDLTVVVLDSRV